jgi:hypothetical protein
MRTTVTLDPDVEALLRAAMREREGSFKQVLNQAVRQGLRRTEPVASRQRYEQPTFDLGRPLVDLARADRLADELEDLDLIAKLRAH